MDKETVPDMGIPEESNYSNTTDPILIQKSSEHRLLKLRHARDSPAQCISAVLIHTDWWCHCVWRSCSGCWTPLQLNCFINPVQWWIASHCCKKLELQNTGKRWGCKTDCYEASTKSVNRNHKPPVNQSDIDYVMSHSVSPWRMLLEDQRKSSRGTGNWCPLSEETRAAKLESKNSVKVCKNSGLVLFYSWR